MSQSNRNQDSNDLTSMTVDVCLHKPISLDWEEHSDTVVCEEPMEIQVNGRSLSVMMRTPGDDYELAVGFLLTEQIVIHGKISRRSIIALKRLNPKPSIIL